MKSHNKKLAASRSRQAGAAAGLRHFHGSWVSRLYGGLSKRDFHARSGSSQRTHSGSHGQHGTGDESVRTRRRRTSLRRENVRNKEQANQIMRPLAAPCAAPSANSWHDAGKSAGGREHQKSREPGEKATQGRAKEIGGRFSRCGKITAQAITPMKRDLNLIRLLLLETEGLSRCRIYPLTLKSNVFIIPLCSSRLAGSRRNHS